MIFFRSYDNNISGKARVCLKSCQSCRSCFASPLLPRFRSRSVHIDFRSSTFPFFPALGVLLLPGKQVSGREGRTKIQGDNAISRRKQSGERIKRLPFAAGLLKICPARNKSNVVSSKFTPHEVCRDYRRWNRHSLMFEQPATRSNNVSCYAVHEIINLSSARP